MTKNKRRANKERKARQKVHTLDSVVDVLSYKEARVLREEGNVACGYLRQPINYVNDTYTGHCVLTGKECMYEHKVFDYDCAPYIDKFKIGIVQRSRK